MSEDFIPAVGRTVVYAIAPGVWRPAQIVRVWTTEGKKRCNLVVFIDGSNDASYVAGRTLESLVATPLAWKTSVAIGDEVAHYLPRVPATTKEA